jgi:hypothetical protein
MIDSRPIFLPSSLAPASLAPGLAICGPSLPCARGRSMAWIHGALVLTANDLKSLDVDGWLRSLFVTAVPRNGTGLCIAPLGDGHPFFQAHGKALDIPGHGRGLLLPFAFDLERALAISFESGRYVAFVSARHHRSSGIEITVSGNKGVGAFGESKPAKTAVDHLIQGYALATAGEWVRAVENFVIALEDTEVRDDLDSANLYNAACAAARAVMADEGREAEPRLAWSLGWLAEDLAKRKNYLARKTIELFEAKVSAENPSSQSDAGATLREATLRHFLFARSGDPDIEILRSLPKFKELFTHTQTEIATSASAPGDA